MKAEPIRKISQKPTENLELLIVFCDFLLALDLNLYHQDRGLTKFHAGSK